MRPIAVPSLNCLVGDKPRIPATPQPARRGTPASDVRFVLIRNAERQPVELRRAGRGEVEYELLTVVEEPLAVDRLVMPDRQVARQGGGGARQMAIDGNRLDPVDDVLQPEMPACRLGDVE